MKRVVFLSAALMHYRTPFHEGVRKLLAEQGVQYDLVYGAPTDEEALKADTASLAWARQIQNVSLLGGGRALLWQPALSYLRDSDLVIVGQENRLLLNYPLLLAKPAIRPKIAFFGHGRNFQSRNQQGLAERWKAYWATKVDWWFAYTDQTRDHLESLGFSTDKITVFNNSVDTDEMRRLATGVKPEDQDRWRKELGLSGDRIAVFVGGLYPDKRLAFLVDAAQVVRAQVPDFELVIVGGGPDMRMLEDLAKPYPWIKIVGPKFGREKVELMSLASLFLMPGLVGLAILDAAVLRLPLVTTAFPWHSPEIAYLEEGESGVMVADWKSEASYAEAVIDLLLDPTRLVLMSDGAGRIADKFSIERMAERFVQGVLVALELEPSC